jgi:hypothetical protein
VDRQGFVTTIRLLEDVVTDESQCRRWQLDANREFAVMAAQYPDYYGFEWFLYDLKGERRVELDVEDGSEIVEVTLLGPD